MNKNDRKKVGRSPKYNDLSDAILKKIEAGFYEGFLPGKHALAEEYGVSHPTVMKALRQLAERGVLELRPGVRARILRSSTARRRIGVLLFGNSQGPLHARMMGGMQLAAQNLDYRLVFEHHHGNEDRALEIAQALAADPDMQGFIYWPTNSPSADADAALQYMLDRKVPTLLLPEIPEVGQLPVHSLYAQHDFSLVADYLVKHGYSNIGVAQPGMTQAMYAPRLRQFKGALRKLGQPAPVLIDLNLNQPMDQTREDEILATLRTLDAVCCLSDLALGPLASICLAHGLRVPADLLLTGADNTFPRDFFHSPTLDLHLDRIGFRAVEILAAAREHPKRPLVRETFSCELVQPRPRFQTTSHLTETPAMSGGQQ